MKTEERLTENKKKQATKTWREKKNRQLQKKAKKKERQEIMDK